MPFFITTDSKVESQCDRTLSNAYWIQTSGGRVSLSSYNYLYSTSTICIWKNYCQLTVDNRPLAPWQQHVGWSQQVLELGSHYHEVPTGWVHQNKNNYRNITSKVMKFQPRNYFAYIISMFYNLMNACWWCSEVTEIYNCKFSVGF